MEAPTIRVANRPEAIYERFLADGFGDGLPVIPPTRDRVRDALKATDYDPSHLLGVIPPRNGEATVFDVAVNSVLAGCRPEYLPVVIQAVLACCHESMNLAAIQTTTNPVTVAGFVNGPIVERLGFNAGGNCLGQGNRANATIGRAIRFVLVNIGGAQPSAVDMATHGQPGKFTFFFAENEKASPWPSYSNDLGYDANVSTVTLFGAAGTTNMLEASNEASELLRTFADALRSPVSNDYLLNGEPWLIFGPEHAATLAAGGYDKEAVRRTLWELSQIPASAFSRKNRLHRIIPTWEPILGTIYDDTLIPIAASPDQIRILVAGGPGTHSVHLPTAGLPRSVTMRIS